LKPKVALAKALSRAGAVGGGEAFGHEREKKYNWSAHRGNTL